ncbi:MAG TPA: hypothetical protein VNO21_26720, partial [Polyangiaceae bacterium]|nr:hypothetical protein [Polyangiaceae bacterium]
YSNATVVLMHTDLLTHLEPRTTEALVSWVLAGGTLALVPARIEDLRAPVVAALAGGPVSPAPPPAVLLSLPAKVRPPDQGLFAPEPLEPEPPASPLKFESGGASFVVPIRATEPGGGHLPLGPSAALRPKLQGYAGGNLAPSVFGASAAYGTGEVHLLAFDPTASPTVDDPWVHGRMVDLVTHAWDRRTVNAIAHGGGQYMDMNFENVRRALDPNENFRPALGVAAILLVLYSIFAGPVLFLRAARKGKPFSPLAWAPAFSLVAFFAIVGVGLLARGWRGRSRHLAIVETGAGMARGTVRRFRGFFTSESRALAVSSTDAMSVLSIASADSASSQEKSALAVDRDGVTLEDVNALPWQTIVVQEDGFYDFKGDVSIVTAANGTLDVANHTGRDLENVLIFVPTDGVRYVDVLRDGTKIHAPDAKRVLAVPMPSASAMHPLAIESIVSSSASSWPDAKHTDALRSAWAPLAGALGESVDWWPDALPVVLAEVAGGEGAKRDGSLPVESDRLLLRVIGRGGAL